MSKSLRREIGNVWIGRRNGSGSRMWGRICSGYIGGGGSSTCCCVKSKSNMMVQSACQLHTYLWTYQDYNLQSKIPQTCLISQLKRITYKGELLQVNFNTSTLFPKNLHVYLSFSNPHQIGLTIFIYRLVSTIIHA